MGWGKGLMSRYESQGHPWVEVFRELVAPRSWEVREGPEVLWAGTASYYFFSSSSFSVLFFYQFPN